MTTNSSQIQSYRQHQVYQQHQVYRQDYGLVRHYGGDSYKVVHFRALRMPGFVQIGSRQRKRTALDGQSASDNAKLRESLSRSRRVVFELAMCNSWQYFITLTLASANGDRYDLNLFQKRLSKWLNNLNSRQQLQVKYLIIPEPHQDGAWHFHGLLTGLPLSRLRPFALNERLPQDIRGKLLQGRQVYDWPDYRQQFGWVTAEEIIDPKCCSAYLTKYITKDLLSAQQGQGYNRHLYFRSQGLRRATEVFRGQIRQIFQADYENEHVRVKWCDSLDQAMQIFNESEVT